MLYLQILREYISEKSGIGVDTSVTNVYLRIYSWKRYCGIQSQREKEGGKDKYTFLSAYRIQEENNSLNGTENWNMPVKHEMTQIYLKLVIK
ncbi:hypothetical protein ACS0TY_010311 [Phlomoides rotata]